MLVLISCCIPTSNKYKVLHHHDKNSGKSRHQAPKVPAGQRHYFIMLCVFKIEAQIGSIFDSFSQLMIFIISKPITVYSWVFSRTFEISHLHDRPHRSPNVCFLGHSLHWATWGWGCGYRSWIRVGFWQQKWTGQGPYHGDDCIFTYCTNLP